MRVAIYIRVSTEEQSLHGLSLEAQRDNLEQYAKEKGYEIVGCYADAGITARKKMKHRKELLRLLEDVKSGYIDLIIFTKLDRWFRNISDYYKVQEILDKHKVNWKTIFEDYDTTTANGRLHINIMLSIAQDEADRTSERIKAVFANKIARGETPCNRAPIGYKIENSKLLVDDETKQIAIDIFDCYDRYHSLSRCCRMIREKYDMIIYDYSMRRYLENRTYIGEFKGISNFCEAIIDQNLFYRIQAYRNQREFKNQLVDGRVYLFSGLIYCTECNHILNSNFTIQKQKNGPREYHYYKCRECLAKGKKYRKRANEEKIEKFLLDNISNAIKEKMSAINSGSREKKAGKPDTAKIKKRLEKLKDLYLDDLIDKESYKKEYESLNKQLAYVPQENNVVQYANIKIDDFISTYGTLTQDEKKALWLGIIEKITFDEHGEIRFFLK